MICHSKPANRADRLVQYRLKLIADKLSGESRTGDDVSTVSLTRAPGTAGAPSSAVRFGGTTPPMLIYKTQPSYTKEARKAGLRGTVVLYIEVDPTGVARNVKVVKGLGLGLDEEAIKAVKEWKFKPAQKDGTPVTVSATTEVSFARELETARVQCS
jgi:TonB family protein